MSSAPVTAPLRGEVRAAQPIVVRRAPTRAPATTPLPADAGVVARVAPGVNARPALAAQAASGLLAPGRLLLAALALGWSTDFLFYGQRPGISVPLFVLLLVGTLFALGLRAAVRPALRNLWLLLPLGFFATMVCIRANSFLTLLNLALVGGLLALLAFFYAGDRIERLGLLGYPAVLAAALKGILTQAGPPVATVGRTTASYRQRIGVAAPVMRGVLLALPVLFVFTILLSSADSIFADYVRRVLRVDFLTGLPEQVWRLVLILVAAWPVAGGLLYALGRRPAILAAGAAGPLPGTLTPKFTIGFGEGVTVLALVNALFLAFGWVQFTFLFSGQAARTMYYEAYREYVRGGFGQLLVVAVLTMGLILGLRWIAWKETPREARILNSLSTVMIALAGMLLVSAFMRMLVWESVEYYINTQLRLYVRWFIVWLGAAFGWLLLTLWVRPERFALGAFLAALGFCVSINLANPDADVAAFNLARHDELATRYLSLLSDDAVPALVDGFATSTGAERTQLRQDLSARLWQMEADPTWQSWPAFHLARRHAYDLLLGLRQAGQIDGPLLPPAR